VESAGQIILGALIGTLASLAAFFAQRRSDQQQRRETEWRQAQSLLRGSLGTMRWAANALQSVDLQPVSKAYYELFDALSRHGLVDAVARVYGTAVTYNDGRQQPGGAQRQHDLLAALAALSAELDRAQQGGDGA
jgi:hypothetical protein